MIIHGDNLEALKSLLPKYENKVDCIYIDPPYNTAKSSEKIKPGFILIMLMILKYKNG